MLYKITTAHERYKEWPHTRRLEKVWFMFKELTKYNIDRTAFWYDCELVEREITKEMTSDEVIKLSTKFSIILHKDEIQIYDWYIE